MGCSVMTTEKAGQATDLWMCSVHTLPAWGLDSWEPFYFMDSLLCYHASTHFGRLNADTWYLYLQIKLLYRLRYKGEMDKI
jgi:hypothetical protein